MSSIALSVARSKSLPYAAKAVSTAMLTPNSVLLDIPSFYQIVVGLPDGTGLVGANSLTDLGKTLVPIVESLAAWGERYFELRGVPNPCGN